MDRCVKLGIEIKITAIQTGNLIMELKEWHVSAALRAVNDIHNLISQQEITTKLNYLKKWNRSFKVDKLLKLFYETVTPLKDIHGKIQ